MLKGGKKIEKIFLTSRIDNGQNITDLTEKAKATAHTAHRSLRILR
jgi:hypothetical protein